MRKALTTLPALFLLAAGAVDAQSVALTGTMGNRALLVIDGAAPQVFAPGDTRLGVTLVSADSDVAVVEIQGQRQELHVGESPVSVAGHDSDGNRIVLTVGSGGHFSGTAVINGKTLPFVVDTGATYLVMNTSQADQLGLPYRKGPRGVVATANGRVAAWHAMLDVVRIGTVETYHVQAEIVPNGTPFVLLGNSFLARFRMRQENDRLILEKQY